MLLGAYDLYYRSVSLHVSLILKLEDYVIIVTGIEFSHAVNNDLCTRKHLHF